MKKSLLITGISFLVAQQAQAILLTDSDAVRIVQGVNLAAFSQLYYSGAPLTKEQQLIAKQSLDDDFFNTSAYRESTLPSHSHWLEHFKSDTDIQWDRFSYALGTQSDDTVRYASSTKGSNTSNGIPAAKQEYRPRISIPEPSSLGLMLLGAMGILIIRRKYREIY